MATLKVWSARSGSPQAATSLPPSQITPDTPPRGCTGPRSRLNGGGSAWCTPQRAGSLAGSRGQGTSCAWANEMASSNRDMGRKHKASRRARAHGSSPGLLASRNGADEDRAEESPGRGLGHRGRAARRRRGSGSLPAKAPWPLRRAGRRLRLSRRQGRTPRTRLGRPHRPARRRSCTHCWASRN